MSKDIKDYLHLYLGCDLYAPAENEGEKYGIFKLTPEKLASFLSGGKWSICKPILRQLSDMSEEEAKELNFGSVTKFKEFVEFHKYNDTPRWFSDDFRLLLSKGFDLFNLIDAGLALNKQSL